jgi:hypothetical protein
LRTFVSAVAVILGLMLAAVAVPAMWIDRNIVQEDGFVQLAAPLGKQPEFQQRLAAAAVSSFAPTEQMSQFLSDGVRPVLEAAATSLTGLPGYPAAWEETLRKSHRLSFSDPSTLPAEASASTSLTLDVAPLVGLLTRQISDATGLPLTAPEQTLIHIGQSGQRELLQNLAAYAPMGSAMAGVSALALLLALATARRRWLVLVVTGLGGLLLAALWNVGTNTAAAAASATPFNNPVAEIFKNELVTASSASFGQWIAMSFWVAGFLLLAGIVLGIFSRRRQA